MSYKISVILLILTLLCLPGCAKNPENQNPSDTEAESMEKVMWLSEYTKYPLLKVNEDTAVWQIGKETCTLRTRIVNNSGKELYFGTRWILEMQCDGEWYTFDYVRDENGDIAGFFEDVLYILPPAQKTDLDIRLLSFYQLPLQPGTYRLIQLIDDQLLSLEFTVN